MKKKRTKISLVPRGPKSLNPICILVLVFAAFLFLSSGWQIYKLNCQVTKEITRLNEQKEELVLERRKLEEEIAQLNTPSYIEQLAREQLGLVKRGEVRIAPKK